MITLKQHNYHKEDYIFLYSAIATMVQDIQDECKQRKKKCENCEYKTACKDLELLNDHLQKKVFKN